MVCHHCRPCNCDKEPLEWWKLLITTCVTVASALNIGNKPWTKIFTAYFFAVLWLMTPWGGPDRRAPDILSTFMLAILLHVSYYYLVFVTRRMKESTFTDGWGLTVCIIILTIVFTGMYEEVRQVVIEELLSQEKRKRQRERRGGW